MVGLLDIAPSSATVEIRGAHVSVPGVSAAGIAYLINRFPEIRAMFEQKGFDRAAADLFTLVPNAIAAILACGTGAVGDPEAEKVAASLTASDQLKLMEAILAVTMPGGARPFVERMNAIMGAFGVELDADDLLNEPGADTGKA
jgi:hypothetical protein